MKIFVGSSSEGRDSDTFSRICQWIESQGHEALRWDAPGLFPLGSYTLEVLGEMAVSVDAAVLLMTPDDQTWYREEVSRSPRDNVLLEYGLFAGVLGRKRVAIVSDPGTRQATDLAGLTVLMSRSNQWARMEAEFRTWLTTLPRQARWRPPEETPESPFQASGKRSLFESGTQLIDGAKTRIALVAKTPVLLMGPRPYGSRRPYSYEETQFKRYSELAERAASRHGPTLLCIADRTSVAHDLGENDGSLVSALTSNYERIKELAASESGFAFAWQSNRSSMSYLVADDDFLVWMKDESGESVWIVAKNESVANALYHQAMGLSHAGTRAQDVPEVLGFLHGEGGR